MKRLVAATCMFFSTLAWGDSSCGIQSWKRSNLNLSACDVEFFALGCDLLAKDSEVSGHVRKCPDRSSVTLSIKQMAAGCYEGGKGAWDELLQALIINPYDYMINKSPALTGVYLRQCADSLKCKSDLFYEIHSRKPTSSETHNLNQMKSIAEIDVFWRTALSIRNSSYNQNLKMRQALKLEQSLAKKSSPLLISNNPSGSSFWSLIQDDLFKKFDKFQCVDQKVASEMVCYAIFSFVDPLLAVGLIAKFPAIAKFLKTQKSKVNNSIKNMSDKLDEPHLALMRDSAINASSVAAELHPIWQNSTISINDKMKTTFEKYIEARSALLPPEKQKIAKDALENIKKPLLFQNAAHYNPRNGMITLGDNFADDLLAQYTVLVHEFEHLSQFGTDPKYYKMKQALNEMMEKGIKPPVPASRLQAEFEAIGSQWDFLQAIPSEVRVQALKKIEESKNLSASLKEMLKKDVELASLSREAYIRGVQEVHGYTSANMIRERVYLGLSFFGMIAFSIWDHNNNPSPNQFGR